METTRTNDVAAYDNHHESRSITMQVLVNFGDVDHSPAIEEHAVDRAEHALRHVSDSVTRVEVHLRDDKQRRVGDSDKRCVMEARIAGKKPLTVDDTGKDIYVTITSTADKLGRAVTRSLAR